MPSPKSAAPGFAVVSEVASAVTLCLFAPDGTETQLPLPARDSGIWHGFVPGIGPGQRYGYRVAGPYDPANGHRCNPDKLLLDPYARADRRQRHLGRLAARQQRRRLGARQRSGRSWSTPTLPGATTNHCTTPYADSVIYEVHVKGLTAPIRRCPKRSAVRTPASPTPLCVQHLTGLGVTAVELLPVHHSLTSGTLQGKHLDNYWGYDTLGYFAPHAAYSSAVRAGRRGRTAGGVPVDGQDLARGGPRGHPRRRLQPHRRGQQCRSDSVPSRLGQRRLLPFGARQSRRVLRHHGHRNSLNTGQPDCLRLILDSLRYWVTVCHVDGFRFDLASTLARQDGTFTMLSAFLDVVHQDPTLCQTKLIAEPWDVGQIDSYDVGRFPPGWSEWNGKYRDTVRDFWRSTDGLLPSSQPESPVQPTSMAAAGASPRPRSTS